MEYIYFVLCLAAVALVMYLLWNTIVTGHWLEAATPYDLKKGDSAPPRKKTVSGISEEEETRLRFQSNIDAWQRNRIYRQETASETEDSVPVSGRKYTFSPVQQNHASNVIPIRDRLARRFQIV